MPIPKLKKSHVHMSDAEDVRRKISRCERWGQILEGLPYDDPIIGADGIHLDIFAPATTSDAQLTKALRQGRAERDVVSYSITLCPQEWFGVSQ